MTNYQNIITINPEKRFGKPCIRDTRISVYDLLSWLASGMTHEEIANDYPEITEEDISACPSYTAERERKIVFLEDPDNIYDDLNFKKVSASEFLKAYSLSDSIYDDN
ncbi:MAG: DUF433 domain-containing protein [Bacteroidales bacterium]|nr:DUF433 domain-containing protein [Bacteroidales bacterium]